MFGSYNTKSVVVSLDYDPAADDYVGIWRAPQTAEIVGAYAWTANDVAASGTNYFSVALVNGGTDGTATTAIAGAIGGTPGWTGLTPKTFTITNGSVTAGQVVAINYDETGTGTFGQLCVQLDYVLGQA